MVKTSYGLGRRVQGELGRSEEERKRGLGADSYRVDAARAGRLGD